MRTAILVTDHRPAPWDDAPRDWPVLLRTVREHQEAALAAAGCTLASPQAGEPALVLTDDVFFTPEVLRDALVLARARWKHSTAPQPLVVVMAPSQLNRRLHARSMLAPGPEGSLPVPLLLLPDGAHHPSDAAELLAAAAIAEPLRIDPRERSREVPAPKAWCEPGKDTITFAASTRLVIHLTHRSHLLQVNLEALGADLLRALSGSRLRLVLRWLWTRLSRGRRGLLSRMGRGVRIDPTAIVEGCRLGDGVEIGAFAVVRGSILGSGACVEDGAHVHLSVLGPRSRVARQTAVFGSVLLDGSHSAQGVMQLSVLGRDAATTSASWFTDVRFGSNIKVELPGGGWADTGSRFLGCDVGHDCVVGAGVIVAPGRMLPSHCRVVADPATILSRVEPTVDPRDAQAATLVVRQGRLGTLS